MFDPDGGGQNVFTALLLISSFIFIVGLAIIPALVSEEYAIKFNIALAACFGFGVWLFLLYVGNPGLEFWAPAK